MPEPRRTQKEIAGRYSENVDYASKAHPWRRSRFWASFIAIVGGAAAIYFAQKRTAETFFNTGPLSRQHAALQNACAECHDDALTASGGATAANVIRITAERFQHGHPFEQIDNRCRDCHASLTGRSYAFHEPNVLQNRSCSACHAEHQGPGAIKLGTTLDCASCHNSREIMQASAQRGRQLAPAVFRLNPKVANPTGAQRVILRLPRPPEGYTKDFASFENGHPEFAVTENKVRDPDVLRFNHQRHLDAPDMPLVKGRKLDCNYCHVPQPDGRYMQRISYEANCKACHALQFDVNNPTFVLPHGDASLVRTFLRTLPAQYAEFGRREKRLTDGNAANAFAGQQVRRLLAQFRTVDELERSVFLASDPYKAAQQLDPMTRAKYTGCAFCHEVKVGSGASFPAPEVTRPVVVDRWMPHASFNHAKHQIDPKTKQKLDCTFCHAAVQSQLTADVLMPEKQNCVVCHSASGKVVSDCMTCHTYHAPDSTIAAAPATAANVSFKQMLHAAAR